MEKNVFELVMERCTEKKVVSRCKKMIKKSSLTSMATVTTLTELAYWLYVYEHKEEALMVCEFSHLEDPAPYKVNYNIWDFILFIWGLEAHILREMGNESACQERISAMDRIWHIPSSKGIDTPEQIEEREQKRRLRIDIDYSINKRNLDLAIESDDKTLANGYRFVALYNLIGYGVTGLFPKLVEEKKIVDDLIKEYINILNQ